MGKKYVLMRLAEKSERLKTYGVKSLAVFGSVARGESGPRSDIDFLVEFTPPPTFSRYMGLKLFLEDLFGRRVDLSTRKSLRRELRRRIEQDAIRVA